MRKEDQNIILELRQGDKSKFRNFYLSRRAKFLNWAKKKFGLQDEEALELYQESMAKLYENIIKCSFVLDTSLEAYLYGLAKNTASTEIRKQEIRQRHEGKLTEHWRSFYESQTDTQHFKALVISTLPNLKATCRQLLKWFYFEQKSLEDIVHLSDYKNKDVVKTQKSRCLQYLEKQVRENMKQEK